MAFSHFKNKILKFCLFTTKKKVKSHIYSSHFVHWCRRVATCKPGKPGLTSFSETLALFFIRFRKMKVQDRQNGPSKSFRAYQKKTGWLHAYRVNYKRFYLCR